MDQKLFFPGRRLYLDKNGKVVEANSPDRHELLCPEKGGVPTWRARELGLLARAAEPREQWEPGKSGWFEGPHAEAATAGIKAEENAETISYDPNSPNVVERILATCDHAEICEQLKERGVEFDAALDAEDLAKILAKAAGYRDDPHDSGQKTETDAVQPLAATAEVVEGDLAEAQAKPLEDADQTEGTVADAPPTDGSTEGQNQVAETPKPTDDAAQTVATATKPKPAIKAKE